MRLANTRVIISGGATGLGAAIAQRFVDEGAAIVILDRNEGAANQLSDQLGASATHVCGDVRDYAANRQACETALEQFGGIDAIIGNAAIWDFNTRLHEIDEAKLLSAFDEIFSINVAGYVMLARAAIKALIESEGRMVFTVSNAGFHVDGGGVLYTASKHAVVGLIRQLAFECAPWVRVNGVAPGVISGTSLRGPAALGLETASFVEFQFSEEGLKSALPLPNVPVPEDYVDWYVMLASKHEAKTATGAIIECNGGFSVRGLDSAAGGYHFRQED